MTLGETMRRIGIKPVPYNIIMCTLTSLLVFLFGFDTGSIGTITTMTQFTSRITGPLSSSMHGVIVSSSLLTGAMSAFLAGVLADKYGRTRLLALGALLDAVGVTLECAAPSLAVFLVGRLLKGTGSGLYLSTVYVQVSEMAPARIRGAMTAMPQFCIVVGTVIGYFTCYATAHVPSTMSWRIPLAIGAGAALVLAALVTRVVPSPRWLLACGRSSEACAVMQALEFTPAEQAEMLAQFPDTANEASAASTTLREDLVQLLASWKLSFRKPFRRPTLFGCFLLGMQSFSGIDGVLYYAPTIFRQAGLESAQAAFLASGVSSLTILAATIPGTIWADSWGRRTASIYSGLGQAATMLVIGVLYAADLVHKDNGAARWVVIVSVYLFTMIFSAGWALCLRTYLVESLPRQTRAGASSLAQSTAWATNFLVALTTPMLLALPKGVMYFFFGGLTLFTAITCVFYMSETRGKSLETIEKEYMRGEQSSTPMDSESVICVAELSVEDKNRELVLMHKRQVNG